MKKNCHATSCEKITELSYYYLGNIVRRSISRRLFTQSLVGFAILSAGCTERAPRSGVDGESSPTQTEPEPKQCPRKPAPLTAAKVAEFAVEFERAYVWNSVLDREGHVSEIEVVIGEETTVEETDQGYLVYIDEVFVSTTGDWGVSDDEHIANYYITDNETLRSKSSVKRADPRQEGSTVECSSPE